MTGLDALTGFELLARLPHSIVHGDGPAVTRSRPNPWDGSSGSCAARGAGIRWAADEMSKSGVSVEPCVPVSVAEVQA